MNDIKWKKVILAGDCEPCEMCGDPICPVCVEHYAECECPGPHQEDEYEYKLMGDIMYARKLGVE
jgi:hypothetical protein